MKPLTTAQHDTNCNEHNKLAASKEEHALNVAFFSFVAFCILETVFGTIAKSESMLADAHAMSIDAMTYLFNMAAEHYKKQPLSKEVSLRLSPEEQTRRLELRRLYLELVPPAISVCILFTLTAMTLVEAGNTLLGSSAAAAEADGGEDKGEEDDVSVPLMLGFSAANLLLDFVNVAYFSRANATYGLNVVVDLNTITKQDEESHLLSSSTTCDKMDQPSERTTRTTGSSSSTTSSSTTIRYAEYGAALSSSDDDLFDDDDQASISSTDSSTRPASEKLINLNMCSAWTHVCADTLRSLAVVIAALVATLFPAIPGETADAAAAVAVSIIIFVSLIPLIQGLVITSFAIRHLLRNPTSNKDSTAAAACSYHECSAC